MYFRDLNNVFIPNKHIYREAGVSGGNCDAGRSKAQANESRDHGLGDFRDKKC